LYFRLIHSLFRGAKPNNNEMLRVVKNQARSIRLRIWGDDERHLKALSTDHFVSHKAFGGKSRELWRYLHLFRPKIYIIGRFLLKLSHDFNKICQTNSLEGLRTPPLSTPPQASRRAISPHTTSLYPPPPPMTTSYHLSERAESTNERLVAHPTRSVRTYGEAKVRSERKETYYRQTIAPPERTGCRSEYP
jgi:hypothetical protein